MSQDEERENCVDVRENSCVPTWAVNQLLVLDEPTRSSQSQSWKKRNNMLDLHKQTMPKSNNSSSNKNNQPANNNTSSSTDGWRRKAIAIAIAGATTTTITEPRETTQRRRNAQSYITLEVWSRRPSSGVIQKFKYNLQNEEWYITSMSVFKYNLQNEWYIASVSVRLKNTDGRSGFRWCLIRTLKLGSYRSTYYRPYFI